MLLKSELFVKQQERLFNTASNRLNNCRWGKMILVPAELYRLRTESDSRMAAPNAKDIALKARNKNMWVYHPSTKTWYNPDEFQAKYERAVHGLNNFLAQVQVRDPFYGISAGL